MGDLDQIDALLQSVSQQHGRLDVLVNNAATNPQSDEMINATEALWNKIFEVNLRGPFFLTQRAVPLLAASGAGSVINTASIDGLVPGKLRGVYSMSKAAVIAMTKAYAKELAQMNIRVNAIVPGLFGTHMAKSLIDNEEAYTEIMRTVPLRRHGRPQEVAGLALYLASGASSYTTGSIIVVDGGATA
jgi:NAD(P)-dependent dehydrogenase (short-subunit alcohol dehydrogenase family)